MLDATNIRVGNVIRIDGKFCKTISQEIRGTGKFGKTVQLKLKSLEDGHIHEKSVRAEDKVENVDVHRVKMQYLYRENDQFVFMNTETFEQFPIPAKAVGKQEVFLKENSEIDVFFAGEQPVTIDFPKIAEIEVVNGPPAVKGGSDTTYKEVELENGLKVLAPQFVKVGEKIRINVDDLTYIDRVTTKTLGRES